ncbi:MAG TPA: efflux RND transporter periplasmic adaptor subunit [Myxococcota bacterium]|jgi:HlyD family secretion protein
MSRARLGRLGVLLAAAIGAASCGSDDPATGGYLTESVDRGAIVATVTATGTVQPVSKVQVGTYVSGPIQAIYVDFNSPVVSGQPVAKIDPAPFEVKVRQEEANLANARASVEKARADLKLKKLTFERNQSLRTRDLISQDELDTSESNRAQAVAQLALAEAGVKQAAAGLEEARITLDYTVIRSPVDGVVISRSVDVGQTVAASFQTPTLFEIAQDLTKMQLNANVSESDIGGLRDGLSAAFGVDAYPGREFEGRVVQVRNAPITVLNVVTYDVIIEVDNRDLALKPGMTATVTITTARREDALRVPLRALRFRPESDGEAAPPPPAVAAGKPKQDGSGVYVLDGGDDLRRVELRTGLRDERFAEVLEGDLAPGAAVAVAYRKPLETNAPAQSPFLPARRR